MLENVFKIAFIVFAATYLLLGVVSVFMAKKDNPKLKEKDEKIEELQERLEREKDNRHSAERYADRERAKHEQLSWELNNKVMSLVYCHVNDDTLTDAQKIARIKKEYADSHFTPYRIV